MQSKAGESARRALLEALLEGCPEAIVGIEGEAIAYLNPAAARLLGLDPATALGAQASQLPPLLDRDGDDDTTRWRRADGATLNLVVSVAKTPLGAGSLRVAVLREAGPRQETISALRKSEERFRDVTHSMADWVWEVDTQGRYTYASGKVKEVLGYESEELLGTTPFDWMPPEEATRIGEVFRGIVANKEPIVDLENWNVAADGRRVCLLTNGVPLIGPAGDLLGYRGVDKDITDRKKSEEALGRMQDHFQRMQRLKALGTLAGGIAHDFNNLLTPILGFASMIGDDLPADSLAKRQLGLISTAASRAQALVKQILAFSRQDDGSAQTTLLVQPVVEEALGLLRAALSPSIEIQATLCRKSPPVFSDATRIHQVVMNLGTNAVCAMPEGGVLEIRVERQRFTEPDPALMPSNPDGEFVRLLVRDTGNGISADTREHLFEPFFTTREVGQGTGMGLAQVHGIVSAHGGGIALDSAPGAGSTFRIYLPACEFDSAKEASPDDTHELPGRGKRVLLVDDEPLCVDFIETTLTRNDFRVASWTQSLGAQAAFLAAPDAYDLVIADEAMPKLRGLELAERILGARPETPIILVTGHGDPSLDARAQDLGIKRVVTKPLTGATLLDAIREVLDL